MFSKFQPSISFSCFEQSKKLQIPFLENSRITFQRWWCELSIQELKLNAKKGHERWVVSNFVFMVEKSRRESEVEKGNFICPNCRRRQTALHVVDGRMKLKSWIISACYELLRFRFFYAFTLLSTLERDSHFFRAQLQSMVPSQYLHNEIVQERRVLREAVERSHILHLHTLSNVN